MASARSASVIGVWGWSPQQDPEQSPGGGRAEAPEADSFLSIFMDKVAKSQGFKWKIAPPRQTASRNQDQP